MYLLSYTIKICSVVLWIRRSRFKLCTLDPTSGWLETRPERNPDRKWDHWDSMVSMDINCLNNYCIITIMIMIVDIVPEVLQRIPTGGVIWGSDPVRPEVGSPTRIFSVWNIYDIHFYIWLYRHFITVGITSRHHRYIIRKFILSDIELRKFSYDPRKSENGKLR